MLARAYIVLAMPGGSSHNETAGLITHHTRSDQGHLTVRLNHQPARPTMDKVLARRHTMRREFLRSR